MYSECSFIQIFARQSDDQAVFSKEAILELMEV